MLNFREIYALSSDWKVAYWSGVFGGILMLILFSYPIRKYLFAYNGWGTMKQWFSAHVFFGSLLTALLVFHTNFFNARSLNGRIAFYSILVVVASGFVGRYILRRIQGNKFWANIFSYWHIAHVPIIYSALIFVLVHVYAVHVY